MALWIQETRMVVKKFKNKKNLEIGEKSSTASLSSSRKEQNGDKYLYSDWSFVRFVGKAHEYVTQFVQDGNVLVIEKAMLTKEPYTNKEGETVYPKNPQMVVFACHLYEKNGSKNNSENDGAEIPPEDEDSIPF